MAVVVGANHVDGTTWTGSHELVRCSYGHLTMLGPESVGWTEVSGDGAEGPLTGDFAAVAMSPGGHVSYARSLIDCAPLSLFVSGSE